MVLAMRQKLKKSLSCTALSIKLDASTAATTTKAGPTPGSNNLKMNSILQSSQAENSKKGPAATPVEAPIKMYPLNKVRYNGDEKFPFELLCDVPRTTRKATP